MSVLPDYLAPNLRVVFCGTAAGNVSAAAGHYYAGPGNEFWAFLHDAKIVSAALTPDRDDEVLGYGVGLTDLAKKRSASSDANLSPDDYDVSGLVRKMERYRPGWLAFHGKTAANVVSRSLGLGSNVALGTQEWTVGGVRVFVLPSGSGANRGTKYLEGKPTRLAWFKALAKELLATPDPEAAQSTRPAQGDSQLST
jgi:TDG/mug DNA glycosylase family protein